MKVESQMSNVECQNLNFEPQTLNFIEGTQFMPKMNCADLTQSAVFP